MLCGVVVPLVTPLRHDGAVCGESVAALSRFVRPHVSAVAPCLTTGEGWRLSREQWADMIRCCLAHFGADRVVAGVELATTEEAVARANLAVELGCRMVIASKPFGRTVTQGEIWAHYAALSSFTQAEVFVYSETWLSQNTICPDTFLRLAAVPRIAGIKESTGDARTTAWLLEHRERLPPLFQGREELLSASRGCAGLMLAVGNLAPEACAAALAEPAGNAAAEALAICRAHNLLSDRWIAEIKYELYRRGVLRTPGLATGSPPPGESPASEPAPGPGPAPTRIGQKETPYV